MLIVQSGVLLQELHRVSYVMLLGKNNIRAAIKGVSFVIGKAILGVIIVEDKGQPLDELVRVKQSFVRFDD